MQKLLIILGIVILVIGLLYPYIKKLGLGQLPGDIMFKSGNSTFFFPIVTCIIISVVLTIIFNLFKCSSIMHNRNDYILIYLIVQILEFTLSVKVNL